MEYGLEIPARLLPLVRCVGHVIGNRRDGPIAEDIRQIAAEDVPQIRQAYGVRVDELLPGITVVSATVIRRVAEERPRRAACPEGVVVGVR